jgi:heme/copper-type cytochrome/quinol oxidase subunit 1
MGIGLSIFLIAVGAVLNWGVDVKDPSGFNLNTIGVILMVVGAIGLLASMVIWGAHRDRTVVEERHDVV